MADADPLDERMWERGWEGHSLAQRRRMARLSLAEKLEWLENAQRVVSHLRRGTQDSRGPEPRDPPPKKRSSPSRAGDP